MARSRWLCVCVTSLLVQQFQCMQWDLGVRKLSATESSATNLSSLRLAEEWRLWKRTHEKSYASSNEELERYAIWQSNAAYIENHNKHWDKFGYTLGMNQFGDLTNEEYVQTVRCVSRSQSSLSNITYFDADRYSSKDLPDDVDWRRMGIVTSVKNQGWCRSCYAFSVTGALEGMHALATGKLVSLSEQNILDCSVPYGNKGCGGGSCLNSILYVVDNGGIDGEDSYPYIAKQSLCMFNGEAVETSCTGVNFIRKGREMDLQKAVVIEGPITVAIDSRRSSFQFYSSGIYNEAMCSSKRLTHSMLLVGYGTNKGTDYWLLKNSWGTYWGINGYIKMARNMDNQCGIATRALYPTL